MLASLFFYVYGFIFSCTNETLDTSVSILEKENLRETPRQSDPGWTLGAVEECVHPLPTVSYVNIASSIGELETVSTVNPIEGSVALQELDGDWWIWQVGMQHPFAWSLSGERVEIQVPSVAVRLSVLDINHDGEEDLILTGDMLMVVWSVLRPNQREELLIDFIPGQGIRDAGLIDLDGDGDPDLWAFVSIGLDGERWGYIFEQQAPGIFAEPYEYIDRAVFGAFFDGSVIDWDGDGDPDLYVCNDFGPFYGGNHLLLNENGVLVEGDAGGADLVTACMGTSFADVDMDDNLDIYMTAASDNHILVGAEDGFVEYTSKYKLPDVVMTQMLWGAEIMDYNNDGLLDIFVATSGFGSTDPINPAIPKFPVWMLEQQSDHTFSEVGDALGLEQESASRAVISHDLNLDGVLDLVVTGGTAVPDVYMSEGCTIENWIEVSGPDNSVLRVFGGGKLWTVHLTKTPGMGSSKPAVAHLGLGDVETIDWIKLDIPWKGRKSLLGPISARQRIVFQEP